MDLVKDRIEKNRFKKNLPYIILVLVIFILLGIFYVRHLESKNKGELSGYNKVIWKVGNRSIDLEIANTPTQRYLGLSGRASICLDCGMLFSFPEKKEQSFVMRNMNFPLDIIFIADTKIIKIYHNLRPEGSEPQGSYNSGEPIDYVIS
jgi:uncharacterized membrane protein (UPF0127 family)